jgi:hypothetical protein
MRRPLIRWPSALIVHGNRDLARREVARFAAHEGCHMKNHAFSRVAVALLGIVGSGFLTAVPSGREVVSGFADTGNTYESVGRMIFTVVAPNPRGFPIGTILNSCTVTLIEPDVALTAGHCVASSAQNGQPPWLRAVVTFDRDDSLDESKWIDFAGTAVHPTVPHCMGPCTFDGGDPGIQDTGLIFLANPVPGITPSKLAPTNMLQSVERLQNIFNVNTPMAFAGYGTTDYNGGDFEYSSSRRIGVFTFDRIQDEQWAYWNKGPSGGCYGDSGGPIFAQVGSQQRIVATISDAGDTCTEEETHARADTKYVQDWIKDTIAAR